MACGLPASRRFACATAPSRSSPRMRVAEMTSPSSSTSSQGTYAQPCARAHRSMSAAVPLARTPKRKSDPVKMARGRTTPPRKSRKASGDIEKTSRLAGKTSAPPSACSAIIARRSEFESSLPNVGSSARNISSGSRSKVTATSGTPSSRVCWRAWAKIARCPMCMPSKMPMTSTASPNPAGMAPIGSQRMMSPALANADDTSGNDRRGSIRPVIVAVDCK